MRLFSLEGIDGSGKSTQQQLTADALRSRGIGTETPNSPSRGLLGNFIRSEVRNLDPWLRNKLFLLDIESTNRKARAAKGISVILWDRYVDSFYASNSEMTVTEAADLTSGLEQPARTFLLDVPLKVILDERTAVHDHHTVPDWLEMKRQRYHELAEMYPERIEILDGTRDKEVITQHIASTILREVEGE